MPSRPNPLSHEAAACGRGQLAALALLLALIPANAWAQGSQEEFTIHNKGARQPPPAPPAAPPPSSPETTLKEALRRQDTLTRVGGIGVEFTFDGGVLWVRRVLPGKPAERADIRARDWITHIEGVPVQGLSLFEVCALVQGPVGSPVIVRAMAGGRGGEQADLRLIREEVPLKCSP